jgi:hypothetical protein
MQLGIDPGFGNFKAAIVTDGGPQVSVVPSVVGVGETEIGLLGIGDLGRSRRRNLPDRVQFNGVTYLVGVGVARFARPVQRMDLHRLSDGPELRALFYDTLYRLNRDLGVVDLMIGLPVEVMADRSLARSTLRALRRWLIGDHRFIVNGDEATLTVTDCKAMAQPAGAFFAWGLNDAGKWTQEMAALTAPIAVCDVGFNTLDLFAVQGGEITARYTGGDTVGIRRAAELLINAVRSEHGLTLSLHEADALLRKRRPLLYTTAGEADLRPLVSQAMDTAAAGVVNFVEQRWGNGRQFARLLFTGGGVEALRSALLRQYPHGVILPRSVAANAIGLARYGVRAFRNNLG